MADRFPLILNTSANQIQEIASGDTLDLSGNNIKGVGIITATNLSGNIIAGAGASNIVSGILTAVAADIDDFVDVGSNIQLGNAGVITATTFKGDGDFVELDVDGHTNLDNVSVAGVSTFAGTVHGASGDFSGQILVGVNNSKFGNNYLRFENAGIGYFDHNGTGQNINFRVSNSSSLDTTPLVVKAAGIDVTGNITATGNVSVGGVLTYEDVTNVDSVGIVTAREGVFLPDLKQLKIGNTAAAPDLYLWHNSSTGNSNISNKTGDLFIQGNNGSGTVVNQIAVKSNAAVELNYQGNKKFETKSTGAAITGTLDVGSIDSTVAGADNRFTLETTSSGDPSIFFNAAGAGGHRIEYLRSSLTLNFTNGTSNRLQITAAGHTIPGTDSLYDLGLTGTRWRNVYADTLYGDGSNLTGITAGLSNIVEDTSPQLGGDLDCNNKVVTLNDSTGAGNNRLKIGNAGDLQLFHLSNANYVSGEVDGKDLYVRSRRDLYLVCGDNSGGYRNVIYADNNGTARLYHPASNAVRLQTSTTGVTVTGDLSATTLTGNGNNITQIVTAGSTYNSNLDTANTVAGVYRVNTGISNGHSGMTNYGTLFHANNASDTGFQMYVNYNDGRAFLRGGNKNTFNGGSGGGQANTTWAEIAQSTKSFIPETDNSINLGSTSKRFANIYTNDLNLSNEGGKNDVDETWGDFTIQEGENDLFLINNRSGKKYKFNLTEVK